MSFGEREDELWGVLKPTFKPRVFGDPNLKYAERLLNQKEFGKDVGQVVAPRADARSVLARVVRKAPEVLVKVTGRKKGADHLGAHLAYIGRKGGIALETRDGELLTDKADVQQLAEEGVLVHARHHVPGKASFQGLSHPPRSCTRDHGLSMWPKMGYLLWVAASNLSPQGSERRKKTPPRLEMAGANRKLPPFDFRRPLFWGGVDKRK